MKSIASLIVLSCVILFSPQAARADSGKASSAPKLVKLDSLVNIYKPVLFNHEKHINIAGDCGLCHHQHGSNASMPCKECHAIKGVTFKNSATGSFMACKNCHGDLDPAAPQMPGLKVAYHRQCFQCHKGMGEVGSSPKGCTVMCHDKRDLKTSAAAIKKR